MCKINLKCCYAYWCECVYNIFVKISSVFYGSFMMVFFVMASNGKQINCDDTNYYYLFIINGIVIFISIIYVLTVEKNKYILPFILIFLLNIWHLLCVINGIDACSGIYEKISYTLSFYYLIISSTCIAMCVLFDMCKLNNNAIASDIELDV